MVTVQIARWMNCTHPINDQLSLSWCLSFALNWLTWIFNHTAPVGMYLHVSSHFYWRKQSRGSIAVEWGLGYLHLCAYVVKCSNVFRKIAHFQIHFQLLAPPKGEDGLGEHDVWASAVLDGATDEENFIYWAVGKRSITYACFAYDYILAQHFSHTYVLGSNFGRIVKVKIGGTNTASSCTTSCFAVSLKWMTGLFQSQH